VDAFFQFSTNNILHEIILQMLLLLCMGDVDDMMGVLVSTNLCDRLGEIWSLFGNSIFKDSNSHQLIPALNIGQNGDRYFSYFGHVAIISNMIVDLSEERPCVLELIEVSEKWKDGIQTKLDEYNQLSFQTLLNS